MTTKWRLANDCAMKIKKKPAQKENKGVVKRIDWSDSCQEPGGKPFKAWGCGGGSRGGTYHPEG